MRPGIFFPDKALALGVPRGPLWSKLQGGEEVRLPDGSVVTPSQVMGDERKGRKFCFATDTIAAPGLAEFARKSDLFICEGMFAEDLAETAAEKKHLTAAQAARIARESGVKRLGSHPLQPALLREGAEDAPGRGAGDLPGVVPHAGPPAHRAAVRGLNLPASPAGRNRACPVLWRHEDLHHRFRRHGLTLRREALPRRLRRRAVRHLPGARGEGRGRRAGNRGRGNGRGHHCPPAGERRPRGR